MTENKAKKNLELLERCYRVSKKGSALHEVLIEFVALEDLVEAIQALEEIQQYRAIGTVEEFKALKEKNTPIKPIVRGLGQRYCPICKCGGADHFYCTRCGQKLG